MWFGLPLLSVSSDEPTGGALRVGSWMYSAREERTMRIVRVHNRYQMRGGEDIVFEVETTLLRQQGHQVEILEFDNHDIPEQRSVIDSVKLAGNTIWSTSARRRIGEQVDKFQPDIVHFDNTFPLISPAAYGVVRKRGVAVVQTLHNFRLLCPSGVLFHNNRLYEDNVGKLVPWRAVKDRVYRDSFAQSAVVAAMLFTHRLLRTWSCNVDQFIALTDFQRQKYLDAGFRADRIVVKPNFAIDPNQSVVDRCGHFLYVGRLSFEKGIPALADAFSKVNSPLRIAGDGPLMHMVATASRQNVNITHLGRIGSDQVHKEMSRANAVVLTSECYENFPMTIAESFASGTPVIASKLGGVARIVEHGVTGLHFEAGNADDLATKVAWAAEHPEEMRRMGANARREYEAKYTPDRNYQMIMDIYRQAINHARIRP